MNNCKACGKEIAKGVKKCPHCGKDQRSFFMKHKILSGILILVVLGMFGAILGDGNEERGSSESSKAKQEIELEDGEVGEVEEVEEVAEEAEEVAEEEIHQVGEGFESGELGIVINSVEEKTKLGSGNQFIDDVTTEGKFIVVGAKISNNDKESRTLSSMMFKLRDDQDRKFEASSDFEVMMILDDNNLFLEEVNPGMSRTGIFVFEVPADIVEYDLEVGSGIGFAAKSSEIVKLK